LREILVEAERTGERASDLGDLKGVGEACAIVVALVVDEHLCLVREPAKCSAMDDAITIAPEIATRRTRRLVMEAAATVNWVRGPGRAGPARIHCHVLVMPRPPDARSAVDGVTTLT